MDNIGPESLKDIAAKYEYFIFDCDGVLWHGE
jgi:ribonucleotide monophosphatase NagD (HAD superfamily)